ncbi:hypothetical protein [Bacillus mobilis]
MTRTPTAAPAADIDDQDLFPALLAEDPRGLAAAVDELADRIRVRVEGWSGGTDR